MGGITGETDLLRKYQPTVLVLCDSLDKMLVGEKTKVPRIFLDNMHRLFDSTIKYIDFYRHDSSILKGGETSIAAYQLVKDILSKTTGKRYERMEDLEEHVKRLIATTEVLASEIAVSFQDVQVLRTFCKHIELVR